MTGWLPIAATVLAVPLVVTIHEAGHALMARSAGYRVTSFGIGRGAPLLRHETPGGVVVYLGRWLLAGGVCVAVPRAVTGESRAALYHGGGALAQGLLALALSAAPDVWWVELLARFNTLVLLWNAIPWRVGGVASDGWWILTALRGGGQGGPHLFGHRAATGRLLRFEAAVGSPIGVWYAAALLAWMDMVVGAPEGDEVPPPPGRVGDGLGALRLYLVAERHRLGGRPLASLRALRERDSGLDRAVEAEDLLAIAEARAWLAIDQPLEARLALARVAGVSGIIAQDAAAALLSAALLDGDLDEVERVGRRLAARATGGFLDGPDAVSALWRAAGALAAEGRAAAGAALARASHRAAARQLAGADPVDRGLLIRRLGVPAGVRAETTAVGQATRG